MNYRPGSLPRRPRGAALLSATALLAAAAPLAAAAAALTPTPLAIAGPLAANTSSTRHAGATLTGDDPCVTSARLRALGTMKLPVCAGD